MRVHKTSDERTWDLVYWFYDINKEDLLNLIDGLKRRRGCFE